MIEILLILLAAFLIADGINFDVIQWIRNNLHYRDIIHGVKNLFRWFKTIYNDRDWDYIYTLEILIKKLENQANYLQKNGILENSDEISNEIRYTINLLNKFIKDEYAENALIPHYEKWGNQKIIWIKDEQLSHDDFVLHSMNLEYEKTLTEQEKEQEREEFVAIIHKADAERQEDLKKAFTFMAEHIERWWD